MKIEQFLFSKKGEPRETFSDSHMQEISKLWGKKWAKESAMVSCFWFGGSFQADHGKGKPQNTMPKLRTVVGRTLLSLGLWVLALCTEAKAAEGTPACNGGWAQELWGGCVPGGGLVENSKWMEYVLFKRKKDVNKEKRLICVGWIMRRGVLNVEKWCFYWIREWKC